MHDVNVKSVTTVTKKKEKSNKQKGDEGEIFVSSVLQVIRYITEIHPRTYRPVFLPNGKRIMVSQDNDFHNSFDIKGERADGMLYAQVKWYKSGIIDGGHIAAARRTINKNYPYFFPYQKIQIWMVWKEWVKRPGERRHKEWNFRVWQRYEPIEHNENGYHFFKWVWKEITDEVREEYESYQNPIKLKSNALEECNYTMDENEGAQIVLKLNGNKNKEMRP